MDLGADQVVIEKTGEIAEGETVERSPHVIDRTATTDQGEEIDRTAPIVLTKLNAPIALGERVDMIDSSALIVPAVGEIIEYYVLSSSHETLKV